MEGINKKLVSVIISTRNSGNTLGALLKSLKNQSYKNLEIIVVDNNSTDNTKGEALKFTKLVYDKGPERSVQRNFGAKLAKGQFYLILDSDMVLTRDVIKESLVQLQLGEYGGIIIPEQSFGGNFWAKVKTWERKINENEPYFEASRFFPKKVFWEVGGYDKNLTGPEDWDLHKRVAGKYPIGRIKSYILHNEGNTSIINLMKKKYYYGLSADKYLKKQKTSAISPQTIYFLRPAFYKNWRKLFSNPVLSICMILMLTMETIGGGLGYLVGKLKNKE
jgi:glycosyltransferase involved in cell wall biosynthesis